MTRRTHFGRGELGRLAATWLGVAGIAALGVTGSVVGASGQVDPTVPHVELNGIGYADDDLDGVNDRFCDADGDGVSDVSGTPYVHRFPYRDDDGDGRNDVFRDEDGDGENDLAFELRRAAPGGTAALVYEILDGDGDGINDVLGDGGMSGADLGFLDESTGRRVPFIDTDGDGLNDVLWQRRPDIAAVPAGRRAGFVDRDRDGIQDGRMLHGAGGGAGDGTGMGGGGRTGGDSGGDQRRHGRE